MCQDYQQYGRSDAGNPQPDRTELRMESESVTGRSACGKTFPQDSGRFRMP